MTLSDRTNKLPDHTAPVEYSDSPRLPDSEVFLSKSAGAVALARGKVYPKLKANRGNFCRITGRIQKVQDSELHIIYSDPSKSADLSMRQEILADMTGCADGSPASRDLLGRPLTCNGSIGLATRRSQGILITALARGTSVAVGTHPIPARLTGDTFLPFSKEERDFIESVSQRCRARWVARLWARKEAALRLAGPGKFAQAAETNAVLKGSIDGTVTLPPAPSGLTHVPVAHVHDIASHPEPMAAAVDTHIDTVYAWFPDRTGTVHHLPQAATA